MIDTSTAAVEEHGEGADELGEEDSQDRLPPIQPNAYHGGS